MPTYDAGYRDGFAAGVAFGRQTDQLMSPPEIDRVAQRKARIPASAPRRQRKKDPKMAKALKEANRRGRTKSGKLRAGYTQAKIMKTAHKLRRRM